MTAQERHSEHDAVGAYVLGILDVADAARFEDHLMGCAQCVAHLDEFAGLEPMLAEFAAEGPGAGIPLLDARPSPQLLDRVVGEVAVVHRGRRRRTVYLVAAAAVLIIGGPVVATVVASDSGSNTAASPPGGTHPTSPAEDAFFNHMKEKVSATDPATKVSATVGLEPKPWGTHAVLELKNVKGPLKCSLVAVGKNGEKEIVTSWAVPAWGYGIKDSMHEASKDPLYVHGGAAMDRNQIDHFEVRTFDGKRLVEVDA